MSDETSEDADELTVRNLHNKNSTRAKICILSALTKLFIRRAGLDRFALKHGRAS